MLVIKTTIRSAMMMPSLLLPATCLFLKASLGVASWETCETIDGDCQNGCDRITAKIPLSCEPELVKTATEAQAVLQDIGDEWSSPIDFDDPETGLHMTMFYFCCHNDDEIKVMREALRNMAWKSFVIDLNDVACNLSHDDVTIYLHALPDDQTELFSLAHQIEATIEAAGVTIHHPRKSLFHMTLGRVDHTYPVDHAMFELQGKPFGQHPLCSFEFDGIIIKSSDYEACQETRAATCASQQGR